MERLNHSGAENPDDGLPKHGWESLEGFEANPGDIVFGEVGVAPRVLMDDGKTWARKGGRVERRWNEYKKNDEAGDSTAPVPLRVPRSTRESVPNKTGPVHKPIGVGEEGKVFGDDPEEEELLNTPEHEIDAELDEASDRLEEMSERTAPPEEHRSDETRGPRVADETWRSDFVHPPLRPITDDSPRERRPAPARKEPKLFEVVPVETRETKQKPRENDLVSMMDRMIANDPRNIRKLARKQREARREARREKKKDRREEKQTRVHRGSTNYRDALRDEPEHEFRPGFSESEEDYSGGGYEDVAGPRVGSFETEGYRPRRIEETPEDYSGPRWSGELVPDYESDYSGSVRYRNEKQKRRLGSFIEKFKKALEDYKETSYVPDFEHAGESRRERIRREEKEAQQRLAVDGAGRRRHEARESERKEGYWMQRARDFNARVGRLQLDDETRQDFGYRPEGGRYFQNSGVDTWEPVIEPDESGSEPPSTTESAQTPRVEDLFPWLMQKKGEPEGNSKRRRNDGESGGSGTGPSRSSHERYGRPAHESYNLYTQPSDESDIGDYGSFF